MSEISYMDHGDLVAKNLDRIIAAKGTNPSAVAKAAGMGHTGVRDIILRRSKNPTHETLVKIANVLGVDVAEITSGPLSDFLDPTGREILDLWSQLSLDERRMLINSAKGLRDAHNDDSQ